MSALLTLLCWIPQAVSAGHGVAPSSLELRDSNLFFVDPVRGSDEGTGRDPARPWRTLTHANENAYGTPAILLLAPGEYSEASGEVFPLAPSGFSTIVGKFPAGARIVGPSDASVPVFRANSGISTYSGFEIVTEGVAFDIAFGGYELNLYGLEVNALRGLDVELPDLVEGGVSIGGCDFRTKQAAVTVSGDFSPSVPWLPFYVDIRNSIFVAGPEAAILDFRSSGEGDVWVRSSNNAFRSARTGLWIRPEDPLQISIDVEGSVFHRLGNASGGGPLVVDGVQRSLAVTVARSIFWENHGALDLPGYDPATYVLEQNLVQDPALVGIGGNISGDPRFVAAASGDYHLRPDSPARGVAAPGSPTARDRDLDPRGVAPDDAKVDLGLDEFYPRYHWFHPRPRSGQTTTLRVLGEPGELVLAFASQLPVNPTFDPFFYLPPLGIGWQLGALLSPRPFAIATIGPDGLAEVPVTFPRGLSDVRLLQRGILTQVEYFDGPGEPEFSTNAALVFLTP